MDEIFHKSRLIKCIGKKIKVQKIKFLNARKVNVYICLHIASIKSTAGNKTRLFRSPFHVSTSSRLTLAEAFRNAYVAAGSTAIRSASEENQSVGYVTVLCPSKVTNHSSTADWPKF